MEPIREGLTLEQDTQACLDMLCLCGELGGVGASEAYRTYLRRLIDGVILQRREIEKLLAALKEIAENSHDVEACVYARNASRTK